jgi:hypothetical protein
MSQRSPQAVEHATWCAADHRPGTQCRVLTDRQYPALVVLDTREQLDSLPVGSVVRDAVKDPWRKMDANRWGFPSGQETVFVTAEILARAWGPVTVVEVAQ